MQIRGVTAGVCVPKQLWSNQRVTLFRNGRPVRRFHDFEPRPRRGCVAPDREAKIDGLLKLSHIYPSARRGDRVCYRLPYQTGGKLRSASRCITL